MSSDNKDDAEIQDLIPSLAEHYNRNRAGDAMDLRSCITAIVSLSIMAACTVDSACAWQHPFHERAARLSQATLPGDYMINWNGVFMGTKEPDFRREDCPWINPSHKSDHWRIKASSDAAVKTLRDHVDPTLAGRRLGRAFHYLQDQTEASQRTRDRFSQVFPRAQFRDAADLVLASIEKQSGGITSGSLSFSKYWRDRTREYSSYYDWSQIYSAVDNLRGGFDSEMNKAMNAAPDTGPAIEVFHWYFASLVALQNQIVRLYAKDLKATKTYLDQLVPVPPGRSAMFNKPMLGDVRLDRCLTWAQNCDKPPADQFCRQKGYSRAVKWSIEHHVPKTKVISTGQICEIGKNSPNCGGYGFIECE